MQISEYDIFNFVFFPHLLAENKIEQLASDEKFLNTINYYRSLKKFLDYEVSLAVKTKLQIKIAAYKLASIISLYPVEEQKTKKKNDVLILAADSPQIEPKVTSKTFIDEYNDYLIRLLNFENNSKIYVFSISNKPLKNYKVIIHPSGQTFPQADNKKPIEIDSIIKPDKIEIHFEN